MRNTKLAENQRPLPVPRTGFRLMIKLTLEDNGGCPVEVPELDDQELQEAAESTRKLLTAIENELTRRDEDTESPE